ncbi:hypothetical protein ABPG75_004808 [Micractinium tetrahymenae]
MKRLWTWAAALMALAVAAGTAAADRMAAQPVPEPAGSGSTPAIPFFPDLPGAEEARAWLASYHQQRQGRAVTAPAYPPTLRPPSCTELGEQAAEPLMPEAPGQWPQQAAEALGQRPRRHMILATVGDTWGPDASGNRWLDNPRLAASFDLVVVYFGNSSTFSCPQCLHVFRRPRATKYQLLADVLFTKEWAQLVAGRGPWAYLWLPDDDVVASACDIAQLFAMMEAAHMQLAQRPGLALRYQPFVEIMAPAFSFDFFQAVVRPTLVHSFTGWGLDTVWPFLLGFPQDGMGVVDAVCMTHNGTAGQGLWAPSNHTRSNYAAAGGAAPYEDAWEEERYIVRELFGITDDSIWNAGVPADPVARFVHEFWNVPLLSDSHWAHPAARQQHAAAEQREQAAAKVQPQGQGQRPKRHMILATVGDAWGPDASKNRWLDDPRLAASFDLVAVYFGNSSTFSCPQCLHVFRRPRAVKWQLLRDVLFSAEWAQLVAGRGPWAYLWLPDDDVVASACDIAQLFAMMEAAHMQLAQMSVCRVGGTWVFWPTLFQRPGIALRYQPFVEIMAPAFSFDFFQAVVRPTLVHSFTGWGLDTVWPFMLGFPQDGMGVVDAVCMTHNGTAGSGMRSAGGDMHSNYAAVAGASHYKNGSEEESFIVRELFRISRDAVWNAGVPSDTKARIAHEWWNVPLLPTSSPLVAKAAATRSPPTPVCGCRPRAVEPAAAAAQEAALGRAVLARSGCKPARPARRCQPPSSGGSAASSALLLLAMVSTIAALLSRRRRRWAAIKRTVLPSRV